MTSFRTLRNATEGVPYRPTDEQPELARRPRAVILMPELTPALPLRDVLIHELAHLRRGDASWNLLARLAEALFFFQPLVWLLSQRLDASAEDVCDDYVVEHGGDRSQYARGLLEIAELSTTPIGAPAVAMVSLRSILARRVTRILDPSRSLSTRAGNLLLALVIAGGLAGATVVGFVGLGSHPPAVAEQANGPAEPLAAATDEELPETDESIADTKNENDKEQTAADKELRGTVIGSDGKPVAGAKLYWIRSRMQDLKPPAPRFMATTGKEGTFRFVEPPPVEPTLPASWSYVDRIAITAPGHGFVLTSPGEIRLAAAPPEGILATVANLATGQNNAATRLPPAGEPIRGRLVDIEGRPVAGAKVRIRWFNGENDHPGAQNTDWQTRVRNLLGTFEPVQLRDVLPSATTDAQGRFELREIGPQRLVQLLVQGEGIEATDIVVRNEPGEKIVVEAKWRGPGESIAIYPNDFALAVGPSNRVEGRVFDLDTGEPIAGAVVRAFQVHNQPITTSQEREHFAATTDERGHYRVAGLPIGKANKLVAFTTGDVAYMPVAHAANTSAAGAAAEVDFGLKRGVWAEGRVFDAENGKPFTGELRYYLFRNRELENAVAGLGEAFVDGVYWTNANGEYRLAVSPSRGILAFQYGGYSVGNAGGMDRFRRGFGAEEISGLEEFSGMKVFKTLPHYLTPSNYERVAEVPATTNHEKVRVDMPLYASRPVTVRVRAGGAPVTKFAAYGANERWQWQDHEGPDFDIQDLRPGERRKVFVFQRASNLAGGGFVEYGAEQAVQIDLVKAGSLTGRLVDADGAPIDDAMVVVDYEKLRSDDNSALWARHPDLAANPTKLPVDKNGRFRLDGLIPGWIYHAYVSAPRRVDGQIMDMFVGKALKGVQVVAGEVKVLGDVVIGDDKSETNAAAAKAAQARRLSIRVVDESGRPVSQARIRVFHVDTESGTWIHRDQVLAEAHSDARGECSIDYAWPEAFTAREHFTDRSLTVLADAAGYACDWRQLEPGTKQVELSLAHDDLPLEGRILDLEGRPIQGVTVNADQLALAASDLSEWIEAAKQNPVSIAEEMMALPINSPKRRDAPKVAYFPGTRHLWIVPPGFLPSTTTDENGRFKLTGLGRDRLVRLRLEGANIATTWLSAVTHEMPPVPYPSHDPRFRVQKCFGSRFDFTAEPDQPIAGVVRDAESGQALPGVQVRLTGYASSLLAVEGFLATVTDEQGRYKLRGAPKPNDADPDHPLPAHRLQFVPRGDQPYFRTEVRAAKREGLAAVTCDVALKRAIWLRGRVTDAVTGKPVQGLLEYYPFLSNKAATSYPNYRTDMHTIEGDRYPTGEDGAYQLPALPGRGLLVFTAEHAHRYPQADGAGAIDLPRQQADGERGVPELSRFVYHKFGVDGSTAVREVNPPSDAGEAVCDIAIQPLATVKVALVDADGRPLSGAVTRRGMPSHVAGASYQAQWSNEPLPTAEAEIVGPREQPRTIVFLHRERKLAAAVSLSRDRDPPRRVTLRACGVISGRIVDAGHQPIAGVYIDICAAQPKAAATEATFHLTHQIDAMQTDGSGRFRVELLPPEIAYVISGTNLNPAQLEKTTPILRPGQSLDLGDLVLAAVDNHGAESKTENKSENSTVGRPARPPHGEGPAGRPTDAPGDKPVTVSGTVVDPQGKPLAGAMVYVRWQVDDSDDPPLQSTKTDDVGRFGLSLRWPEFDERIGGTPDLLVMAEADGLAPDCKHLGKDEPLADVALKLSIEKPIDGRVVNAEGRPLAGIDVRVQTIVRYDNDTMQLLLDDVANGRNLLRTGKYWQCGPSPHQPALATTKADGRFHIDGLSANSVVKLHVRGASIRETSLNASTAVRETIRGPVPPVEPPYGPRAGMVLFGSQFDYVAEPGRRVEGVVRDRETGRPVAKAKVTIYQPTAAVGGGAEVVAGGGLDALPAVTDDAGRYVIDGCAKNAQLSLSVDPPAGGTAYFPAALRLDDALGLAEVTKDVELVRGIELRGRIIDGDTGEPLTADIHYAPLYLNKYVAALFEQGADLRSHASSNRDGRFRIVVAPGPGAVVISTPTAAWRDYTSIRVGYQDVVRLFEASPSHRELAHAPDLKVGLPDALRTQEEVGWGFLSQTGSARVILVCPEEQTPTAPVEVRLVRGARVAGKVVDVAGKALSGATAFLGNPGISWQRLATADFTVTALAPNEKRGIRFYHERLKLGAARRITADDAKPLVVKLEPCGIAVGRVLDGDGAAIAGMHVWFYPADLSSTDLFSITDADGRFRTDKLIPGQQYELLRSDPASTSRLRLTHDKRVFEIGSGQTHDFGDLVVKGPVQTVTQKGGTNPVIDDRR